MTVSSGVALVAVASVGASAVGAETVAGALVQVVGLIIVVAVVEATLARRRPRRRLVRGCTTLAVCSGVPRVAGARVTARVTRAGSVVATRLLVAVVYHARAAVRWHLVVSRAARSTVRS